MRVLLTLLALAGLGLGGVVASASGGSSPARASATATVATGSIGPQHEASAEAGSSKSRSGEVHTSALYVREGESTARSDVEGEPSAEAIAVARSVNALDGLVTAYGVRRRLTASPQGKTYAGKVTGLRVDGHMVGDVAEPRRFELRDGKGYLDVNLGGSGMRIVLEEPVGRYPAGTAVHVAVVAASTRRAKEERSRPTPTPTAEPEAERSRTSKRKPRRGSRRRRATLPAPVELSQGGYAFPVYGEGVSVADDFGGPRQIGPHQGNDIFAPFGSPVLAVTDGTLQKVGTLPIAGNRLWLVTDDGAAFFYAHLSAFSDLAQTGRRVEAGDVLGFVGNTGDAEPTPPHVHFEIHPEGIERPAADPHEVLLAWQRREDVAPSAWLRRVGTDTTERPGALVEVRDFIAGE